VPRILSTARLRPAIVTLATAVALMACTPSGGTGSPPPGGSAPRTGASPEARQQASALQQTLVVAVFGEPPSVAARPLMPFSMALDLPSALFNATLDYRDEREVPKPYLAEALPQLNTDTWKVFPDGRMETSYTLKPNLTWHDGTPFKADDFVFAHRVYANPQFGAASSPPIGLMEEVLAPDDRTLVIRWKQTYPDAAVIADGRSIGFQALPRHILEQPYQDLDPVAFSGISFWTSEYVGLGPYRVERWEPGSFIQARAFDGYVLGRPKIDRIEVRFIPDPQTAVANLLAGEAHFVGDFIITVTDGQTLEQQFPQRGGGNVLYSPVSLRSSVVQLRPEVVESPALLDVRVRRALASGMDSALAAEVLTAGKSVTTNTLTSPGVPYYGEIERAIQKHSYDPRQVQQLMEEAGYTKAGDGFFAGRDGQQVQFSVTSSAGAKNESEAATYVDSMRKAGLAAYRRVLPAALVADTEQWARMPGLMVRGGSRLASYTSAQIPTPNNRWRGDNRGGWTNPAYDQAFAAYSRSLAEPERMAQIVQMERLITDEVPVIPHYFGAEVNAHVGNLKGPVARLAPQSSGTFLYVHSWAWSS
jgi:peptide/nickel transport system substrate-binding protein